MIDANKLRKIQDCKGKLKEVVGDEGVIQLAKDGICPHYIIINPITKEESIWFIASELNSWFDSNFVKYRNGNFTQNYTFIHFNEKLHKAYGEVPKELSRISKLYQLPIEHIRTPPGIYFLCKNNNIIYIGKSTNISNRVITHISEGLKDFDSVYFITCPIHQLSELETSLIRYINPELNKTNKKDRKLYKNEINLIKKHLDNDK